MRGRSSTPIVVSVVAVLISMLLWQTRIAGAAGEPANKVSAAGSTVEVISPNENVTLLTEIVKTSNPTDLLLGVSAECAITTELTTTGNDYADAFGAVETWIEIDGKPVPVSGADNGRIVLCNRAESRTTSMFNDEDATIKTYQLTRNANAFNWMALNVGSATHTIKLKATLTHGTTNDASALAAVGKRTMIVEPTKAANGETLLG